MQQNNTYPFFRYSPIFLRPYPLLPPPLYFLPINPWHSAKNMFRDNHAIPISPSSPQTLSFAGRNRSNAYKCYISSDHLENLSSICPMNTEEDIYKVKDTLQGFIKTNKEEALYQLNEGQLSFASLFALREDIEKHQMLDHLNLRNRIALAITIEILTDKKDGLTLECSSCSYIHMVHSVLKWMLETGYLYDGLSNEYDEVLDITAIMLIKIYGEKSVLPIIVDMIFNRYRKGAFINHLVWAFFECRDPHSLVFLANRLKSSSPKDGELAQRLLGFLPGIGADSHMDRTQQYDFFLDWIQENHQFLYYTGESFQQSSTPTPYVIVLEAKYLCKTLSTDAGKTFEEITEREYDLLNAYKTLDDPTKVLLANFSYKLYLKDITFWQSWMQSPIFDQLKVARTGGIA